MRFGPFHGWGSHQPVTIEPRHSVGFVGDKMTTGIGFALSTFCQYHSPTAQYTFIHLSGQYTANFCCLQGLHSWKIPQTMKLPCGNLIPCGKNGFRGTRAKWNMIIGKWMISKVKTFVMLFIGVMVFLARSCQGDQVLQTEWQFEIGELVKVGVIFGCLSFFCISLYTFLNVAMAASILCLNIRHLSIKLLTSKKLSTKSHTFCRPLIRAMAVAEAPPQQC